MAKSHIIIIIIIIIINDTQFILGLRTLVVSFFVA